MTTDKISKLRDKQKQLAEQIRREEGRLKAKERKEETRRKILVGAYILDKASRDEQYKSWLVKGMEGFLTRADDRALFELPPLPPTAENES